MAFTYVTLQRVYETADDQPASGRVEFTPVGQMRNGLTVITKTVGDDLDATGLMSIRLAATTDPVTTPVGVTYRVVEKIDGQSPQTYYVSVPHDQGATLQLADLTVLTSGEAAGFALRNAVDYDDSVAPVDGQAMVWDSTSSKFHPETVAGGGGAVSSVNGQTGAVTISTASLGAQPADSDLTAFAALAPVNGSFLERVGGVWVARTDVQVKSDLALGNVDNTSDAAKPISAATQTALNAKAATASPAFTGTPTAPRFVGAVVTVTYATSVVVDASQGSVFRVTATGDLTIAAITSGANGQGIWIEVLASGAGRNVTYAGVTTPVAAGTWWVRRLSYNQPLDQWSSDAATGGGGVTSVNGATGAVSITTTSLGAQPVDSDLTVIAALGPTDGSLLSRQGGVWTGRTTAQVKTDMALGNVDNTSDANKPISNATATSLAAKAPLVSPGLTNPTANRFIGAVQIVTYASSVTLDSSAATTFRVTATGPLTVTDITNGANGQEIALEVFASGGDRVLTIGGATITIAAGLWWTGTLRYDQTVDTWKLAESNGGTAGGGGGGGGVPDDGSVTNAKVAVSAAISADKLVDGTTNKLMTGAERQFIVDLSAAGVTGANTAELIRDTIGTALTVGSGLTKTVNDGGDTITVDTVNTVTANTRTASYTLVLSDAAGVAVDMNVASANNLTVPPNSSVPFPAGPTCTVIEVAQRGAGQTTIVPGAGVTLRSANGLRLRVQYSVASLRKLGTDEWLVSGDVTL